MTYSVKVKADTTYLRHCTLDFFNSFDGLNRVLTIIAGGYLFQNGTPDIDLAKRALLAWSSIPESKKATSKEEWQYGTDFRYSEPAWSIRRAFSIPVKLVRDFVDISKILRKKVQFLMKDIDNRNCDWYNGIIINWYYQNRGII